MADLVSIIESPFPSALLSTPNKSSIAVSCSLLVTVSPKQRCSAELEAITGRSEERREGKEGRSRWSPYH